MPAWQKVTRALVASGYRATSTSVHLPPTEASDTSTSIGSSLHVVVLNDGTLVCTYSARTLGGTFQTSSEFSSALMAEALGQIVLMLTCSIGPWMSSSIRMMLRRIPGMPATAGVVRSQR